MRHLKKKDAVLSFFLVAVSVLTLAFSYVISNPNSFEFFQALRSSSKPRAEVSTATTTSQIYWGAYIHGADYGINPATGQSYGDPPWDMNSWDLFENHAGKKISILSTGQAWHRTTQAGYSGILDGYYQKFFGTDLDKIRNRGAIPLFTWGSYTAGAPAPFYTQPNFSLSNIINGTYDAYLHKWAADAKVWGHPFFLRFDWEMNGDWYPWSELRNGNSAGQYVQMWRHVHDIFTSEGAFNVTWVWCPNVSATDTTKSTPLTELYPGDSYVDWTCLDGYNKDSTYKSFAQVFKGKDAGVSYLNDSYQLLLTIAPTKPIVIAETASLEYPVMPATFNPTVKAGWITDALVTQLPVNFPNIKAVLWFNWNSDPGSNYIIESSSQSQSAFAVGIALPYYAAGGTISGLVDMQPIQPLAFTNSTPTPLPTVTTAPLPTATPMPTNTPTLIPTNTPTPLPTKTPTLIPTNTPLPSPTPGSTTGSRVVIYAAGTDNKGVYPTMQLKINDVIVAGWANVQGDPHNRVFTSYTYLSPVAVSHSQTKVVFANDSYTGKQGGHNDVNLRVDKISIDGIDYQTESSSVYGVGEWSGKSCTSGYLSSEWLYCGGYFAY